MTTYGIYGKKMIATKNFFSVNRGDIVVIEYGMDGDYCTNETQGTIHCPFVNYDDIVEA